MALEKNSKAYRIETQLPGCCVPACLRMIFNKRSLPALSQEEIGNRLGLVVPPAFKNFFSNVAVSDTPPWGTRIDLPPYNLEEAFRDWRLPLQVNFSFIDSMPTAGSLKRILESAAKSDDDCILCVQSRALYGRGDPRNGHVVLLCNADTDSVSYIDPAEGEVSSISYQKLHDGMRAQGRKNYGGCWIISDLQP